MTLVWGKNCRIVLMHILFTNHRIFFCWYCIKTDCILKITINSSTKNFRFPKIGVLTLRRGLNDHTECKCIKCFKKAFAFLLLALDRHHKRRIITFEELLTIIYWLWQMLIDAEILFPQFRCRTNKKAYSVIKNSCQSTVSITKRLYIYIYIFNTQWYKIKVSNYTVTVASIIFARAMRGSRKFLPFGPISFACTTSL